LAQAAAEVAQPVGPAEGVASEEDQVGLEIAGRLDDPVLQAAGGRSGGR